MKRVSLVDSIAEEIKERIIKGNLKEGDMLESQDEMAKSMNISRPSLREALRRLQLMGLVESKHGCGTFVKTIKPQDFMTPLSSFLPINKESTAELLEARLHLESIVAALAAEKATDDDIIALEKVFKKMDMAAANHDVTEFVKHDVEFHMLVAQGSRNQILYQVVNILRDLLQNLVKRVFEKNIDHLDETFLKTMEYHKLIFESIKSHNATKARNAMGKHIQDVQKKIGETR